MPYRDNRRNNSEEETRMSTMDKIYHDSETFLYKYRWWIILVLAILLGVYLWSKRSEPTVTQTTETVTTTTGTDIVPRLGATDLNIGEPAPPDFNTEGRRLFRI